MKHAFWVKLAGQPPERWVITNFEQFWHELREYMMRNHRLHLEWIIRD
jgi:hypothetical protein